MNESADGRPKPEHDDTPSATPARRSDPRNRRRPTDEKLFGRFHDVAMLVIGFLLTTVAGTIIANRLQDASWAYQTQVSHHQAELARASSTFDEISRLMDERLYATRNMVWAYQGGDESEIELRRASYLGVVKKWNESPNRNLAVTALYFGEDMRSYLEGTICSAFSDLHAKFAEFRKSKDPKLLDDATPRVDRLNEEVYKLNWWMLSRLRDGTIGEAIARDG